MYVSPFKTCQLIQRSFRYAVNFFVQQVIKFNFQRIVFACHNQKYLFEQRGARHK
jgi:hypothetical protein